MINEEDINWNIYYHLYLFHAFWAKLDFVLFKLLRKKETTSLTPTGWRTRRLFARARSTTCPRTRFSSSRTSSTSTFSHSTRMTLPRSEGELGYRNTCANILDFFLWIYDLYLGLKQCSSALYFPSLQVWPLEEFLHLNSIIWICDNFLFVFMISILFSSWERSPFNPRNIILINLNAGWAFSPPKVKEGK